MWLKGSLPSLKCSIKCLIVYNFTSIVSILLLNYSLFPTFQTLSSWIMKIKTQLLIKNLSASCEFTSTQISVSKSQISNNLILHGIAALMIHGTMEWYTIHFSSVFCCLTHIIVLCTRTVSEWDSSPLTGTVWWTQIVHEFTICTTSD